MFHGLYRKLEYSVCVDSSSLLADYGLQNLQLRVEASKPEPVDSTWNWKKESVLVLTSRPDYLQPSQNIFGCYRLQKW